MARLAVAAMLAVSMLIAVPVNALDNVALGADVTLEGNDFFSVGWGGGLVVPAESVVDGVFLPQNTQWDQGAVWWDEHDQKAGRIMIDLGATCVIESFVIQADDNDGYMIFYESPNGWRPAWHVPNYDAFGVGMQTRPDPTDDTVVHELRRPITATQLAVTARQNASNDRFFSVSEVQAFGTCVDDGMPDLIVSELEVLAHSPTEITYGYTIENVGTAPANLDGPTPADVDNVSVQAFLSDNTVFGDAGDLPAGGTILGLSPLGFLDPGGTFTGSFTSGVELDIETHPYLTLMVDWGEVVDELDETNNTAAALIVP